MTQRKSARKHLLTALLVGGIIMSGAAANAHAQSDGGGTIGSGTERGGYLGSGNRDGDGGGGTIGSGTFAAVDGGMLGSGTRSGGNQMGSGVGVAAEDDGGLLGSGGGMSFASVWEFFF